MAIAAPSRLIDIGLGLGPPLARYSGARRCRALAARRRARRQRCRGPHRLAARPRKIGRCSRTSAKPERSPRAGTNWTRKACGRPLSPGDVVYVEPLDGKPGQFRLRQIPEISGAIVAMDPITGRVCAMVGGFSFDAVGVQPRHPGAAPAGLVVQALRLCHRAGERLYAVLDRARRADRDRQGRTARSGRPENFEKAIPGRNAALWRSNSR